MEKHTKNILLSVLLMYFFFFVTGCGGGGNDNNEVDNSNVEPTIVPEEIFNTPTEIPNDLWKPPTTNLPNVGNYFYLETTGDDTRGLKKEYLYTRFDAFIQPYATNNNTSTGYLSLSIRGDERWNGNFTAMKGVNVPEIGFYPNLKSTASSTRESGERNGVFNWNSITIYCANGGDPYGVLDLADSWVAIDKISYEDEKISSLDLRFEYKCLDTNLTFKGAIHFEGEIKYLEAGDWYPNSEILPSMGNYVFIESSQYEYVGKNLDYLYTSENSKITINTQQTYWPNSTEITINGKIKWRGSLITSGDSGKLSPGIYPNLKDISNVFSGEETAGIEWYAANRACSSTKNGWIAVDNVSYEGDVLQELDLRFYQDCGEQHLYGQVHWQNSTPSSYSGPKNPIPENIWKPSLNEIPNSGNYLYFNSQPLSFIGNGKKGLITDDNTEIILEQFEITFDQLENEIYVEIYPLDESPWYIRFSSIEGYDENRRGYYPDITSSYNPARGKFKFSGGGRGCNSHSWLAIDNIEFSEGKVIAIDLRFYQRCEFYIPGTYGVFHWEAP